MGVVAIVADIFIRTPPELAALAFPEASALDVSLDMNGNIPLLWQSTLCRKEKYHRGETSPKSIRLAEM